MTSTGENADDLLTDRKLASRVSRSVVWRLLGRGATLATTALSVVLLTRHLSKNQYGYYIAATTIATFAAVLVDGGISGVAVRDSAKQPERRDDLAALSAGARFLTSLAAVALVAIFVRVTYTGTDRRGILFGAIVVSTSLVATALVGGCQVIAESTVRIGRLVIADVAGRVVAAASLWAVVLSGGGYNAVYVCLAAGGLTNAAVLWLSYRTPGRRAIRFNRDTLHLYRQALPLGLALLLNTLYFRVDAIILSAIRPAAEVALYGLAYRALEMVLSVGSFLLASLLPVMSASTRDRARWTSLADRTFALFLALGLAVSSAGWFVAHDVMTLLGGTEYGRAGNAFQVLLLAGALSWTNGFGGLLLISLDKQGRALWLNVTALTVNVVANVLLIPHFGYMAAAWITAGSEFVNFCGMVYLVKKFGRYRWRPRAWLRSLMLAAVVTALTIVMSQVQVPVVFVIATASLAWLFGAIRAGLLPNLWAVASRSL